MRQIVVDGVAIEGKLIPAFADNKPHSVQVTLGALAAATKKPRNNWQGLSFGLMVARYGA